MSKLKALLIAGAISITSLGVSAQELPYSLQKMLTTEAYLGTLKSMVNPSTYQNPVALCASCHDGAEMARYQQTIGPMLQMLNPVNWINPMAYVNMATPLLDPKSYEMWYNDYIKKYGAALGLSGGEGAAATSEDTKSAE